MACCQRYDREREQRQEEKGEERVLIPLAPFSK